VSEPPFARTEESPPSRWTGLGPALARFALICAGLAVVVGVVAAVIALYYGLTLQLQGDPGAIRPDLVTRSLRALERIAACGQGSE